MQEHVDVQSIKIFKILADMQSIFAGDWWICRAYLQEIGGYAEHICRRLADMQSIFAGDWWICRA
jgi:hypothetical protein